MDNLINNGILPLTFANAADYKRMEQGDVIVFADARAQVEKGGDVFTLTNETKQFEFSVHLPLSARQRSMILAGGLLNYTRETGE